MANQFVVRLKLNSVNENLSDRYLNVFHYLCSVVPTSSLMQELIGGFENDVSPFIAAIQVTRYEQISAEVDSYELDVFALAGFVPPIVGTINGAPLPPNVTAGITLARGTKATRNGKKRFSGIPETEVGGESEYLNNAYVTKLTDLAQAMVGDILTTNANWQPIIYRPETAPGANDDIVNFITDGFADTLVGTQNTRKPGRGN